MQLMQTFIIFIFNVYVFFGSKACFSCITCNVRAFDIDIATVSNSDIFLNCNISTLNSFINLPVMVIIAGAFIAYSTFFTVQVFYGVDINIKLFI